MKSLFLSLLVCMVGTASLLFAVATGETQARPESQVLPLTRRATYGPTPEKLIRLAQDYLAAQEPAWRNLKDLATEIRNHGAYWVVTFQNTPEADPMPVVLIHGKSLRVEHARHPLHS